MNGVIDVLGAVEAVKAAVEQSRVGSKVHYVAVMDERTCEDCSQFHCKEYVVGFNAPMLPRHPNCRCFFELAERFEPFHAQPSHSERLRGGEKRK